MIAIKGRWKDGRIMTNDSVDWPEGCEVVVEPVLASAERIGIEEVEWRDDANSLADWAAWLATLEPLEFTPEEEALFSKFDAEQARFNVEAVREQMLRQQP